MCPLPNANSGLRWRARYEAAAPLRWLLSRAAPAAPSPNTQSSTTEAEQQSGGGDAGGSDTGRAVSLEPELELRSGVTWDASHACFERMQEIAVRAVNDERRDRNAQSGGGDNGRRRCLLWRRCFYCCGC